jgi:hypothetical protein
VYKAPVIYNRYASGGSVIVYVAFPEYELRYEKRHHVNVRHLHHRFPCADVKNLAHILVERLRGLYAITPMFLV